MIDQRVVSVPVGALQKVLSALDGQGPLIREMLVTREPASLFPDNPINALHAALSQQAEPAPTNQCEGCQAGFPVDEKGYHRMGRSGIYADIMRCEKSRYGSGPVPEQPEQSGLRAIHAMILNALDRDAAEGKAVRGEMAAELRAALSAQGAPQ